MDDGTIRPNALAALGTPAAPHALHASENGDRWWLLGGGDGVPVVRHVGNAASGGHVTERGVAAFLARDEDSPQHRALLTLIEAATRLPI